MTTKARTSAAVTAWTELNDRQQGTLRAIYGIDQQREANRRRDAARGRFDGTPAVEWRRIDFAHDPSDRRLVGVCLTLGGTSCGAFVVSQQVAHEVGQ